MYASSALSVKVILSDTTKPVKGRKILVISVEVFSKTKGILLSLVLFIHLLIMINYRATERTFKNSTFLQI